MTKQRSKQWILSIVLLLWAAAGIVFYVAQNAGSQTGGPISLPKMLWLAYAICAWFLVPPLVWSDQSIGSNVRRIFAVFWIAMLIRGVLELIMIYGVGHWHPAYGISHNLLCLILLLAARRSATPSDVRSRRAFRFSGTLIVALLVETAFAAMFMQTGSHEKAIYFASTAVQWTLINYVTWAALAFFYPDLVATLIGLYLPAIQRETSKPLRYMRLAAATVVVLLVTTMLCAWTWMMRVENEARRFSRVGYEILESCGQFRDDFLRGETDAMADFTEPCEVSWRLVAVDQQHAVDVKAWDSDGPSQSLRDAFIEWRARHPTVEQAAFKIHLVDQIVDDHTAIVQLRFEVNGSTATDAGLLRCRFQRARDERWRVADCSLIEGTTTSGDGRHFVDRASERNVAFVVKPDRRFVPEDRCTEHECFGPTKLKFEMMRFAYAGCSAADYDGDGMDDILFCSGQKAALYRNRGDGTFEDRTAAAGLSNLWHKNVAGFADIDNDGDQDLFVASYYGPNHLFANNGDGTFTKVPSTSSLVDVDMVACLAYIDYDNDGDLDLYLGRMLDARRDIPESFLYTRNGQPNKLYRNDGDFQFTDVTDDAGVGDLGLTLSIAAADYDADGDQDLYLANDFGRNVLYQNQGDGTFRDVAAETGTLAIGGSMSASWGDVDGDGRLDLYVAAIRSNQRWFVQPVTAKRVFLKYVREGRLLSTNPLFKDLHERLGSEWVDIGNHALAGNSLLQQQPDATFVDVAEARGARPAGWYWSAGFFDIDNDGDLDIYATDGWITGENSHDL